jgi:hypothetical protein
MSVAHSNADGVAAFASASHAAPLGADASTLKLRLQPELPKRERFIPITRFALIDRLTQPQAWPRGQAEQARRFFRYLDHWRQQQYGARMLAIEQAYEPFSPDSDLLITRSYTENERRVLQRRVVSGMEQLLTQANYTRIDPKQIELIMTRESHYGLDLQVDLDAFDELQIYYRGASSRKDSRRTLRKFMLKQEFEVPIYRRLFILFKLKPQEQRISEIKQERRCSLKQAKKIVRSTRSMMASEIRDDCIYMKLFKNMPRTDIEMIFPNTRVNFRPLDKLKLGLTSGAGLGVGAFSAAGKIALAASNPIAAAGAVAGLGGIAFRQGMNFLNQRQRYMVIMAQNLYFHAMADNSGVIVELAERAAEEDLKEEILLYTVLAKQKVNRSELPAVDAAIERYLTETFGTHVDFEIADALGRLQEEGIVTEAADGTLTTLPPREAAALIDHKWDLFLDHLPQPGAEEGREMEADEAAQA